jgi:hypothetical protein
VCILHVQTLLYVLSLRPKTDYCSCGCRLGDGCLKIEHVLLSLSLSLCLPVRYAKQSWLRWIYEYGKMDKHLSLTHTYKYTHTQTHTRLDIHTHTQCHSRWGEGRKEDQMLFSPMPIQRWISTIFWDFFLTFFADTV